MASDDPFADIGQAKPDDDPFADIGAPSPLGKELGRQAWDVVKQVPTALVTGAEAVATGPAHLLGLAGGLAEKYIPRPSFAPADPEQHARRQELLALIKKQGGSDGIGQYLPEAETTAGKLARTGIETAVSTGFGGLAAPGARTVGKYLKTEAAPLARNLGVGGTAGVASEIAGQATEGTAAEPLARIGTALAVGGAAARQAEKAAARAAIPVIDDAKKAADQTYAQFRASGFQLDPAAAPTYTGVLKTDLTGRGLTPRTAGQTWGVLDDIEKTPFTNPNEFQARYKELGSIARKAQDGEERLAANIAQERLLGFLEGDANKFVTTQGVIPVGPGGAATPSATAAAQQLREANANWAAAMRAENVSNRITKAEQVASGQYSGLGLENELRRRISVLADPTARSRGFSEAELREFSNFGKGTPAQNIRRWATGALAGRGGFAVGGIGLGGLGTYLGTGDPTLGAAVAGAPLAGLTLAKLGNLSALRRARDIERLLMARAPLAARNANIPGSGIPRTQPALPLATLAPTLATLGEEYQ